MPTGISRKSFSRAKATLMAAAVLIDVACGSSNPTCPNSYHCPHNEKCIAPEYTITGTVGTVDSTTASSMTAVAIVSASSRTSYRISLTKPVDCQTAVTVNNSTIIIGYTNSDKLSSIPPGTGIQATGFADGKGTLQAASVTILAASATPPRN